MHLLRRLSAITILALIIPAFGGTMVAGAAAAPTSVAAACAPGERYFEVTGFCVPAVFATYWDSHGDLAQQGWPISPAFNEVNPSNGKTYLTQYFERARFEYHPENAAPYDVLLGLLGNEQLQSKYGNKVPSGMTGNPLGTECTTFPETGQQVCGVFLAYWQTHGALAQQGLPKTPLFLETNPTDGKQYPTQYFERARFEFHIENTGTPYVVLLGLLGREQYKPGGQVAPPIFKDDFTDPTSGWPTVVDPQGRYSAGYLPGEYRLTLAAADFYALLINLKVGPQTNTKIEADMTRFGPVAEPFFGLACRVKDPDNYYGAVINTQGGALIFKMKGGNFVPLMMVLNHPALKRGNETNRLSFLCDGNQLLLAANGTTVAASVDGDFGSGYFAILGISGEQGGLDLHVRNFLVTKP